MTGENPTTPPAPDAARTAEPAPAARGRCPVTGAGHRQLDGPRGFPLSWPVVGSTVLYGMDPPGFQLRVQKEYGTVVKVPMVPHNPTVQVTSPEAIRRILQTNADNYRRGAYYKAFELFMGKGLLTLDDAQWRGHRRVVNPAFTPNAVAGRAPETDAAVADLLDRWSGHARTGTPFDLLTESMALTSRVIGHALVGKDLSQDGGEFAEAVSVALEAIFKEVGSLEKMVPSVIPIPYRRRVAAARRTLERVIAEAARSVDDGAGGDVATLIRESDLPEDAFWSDLVTLFLAGVETTALGLTWTLYEIARSPEERARLEDEADRVLGGRVATTKDLDDLPYAGMAVAEGLRMHPPVWQFTRETIEDDVLADHHVPAATPLLISVYGAHHNPEQWNDPERFDPERFRPGNPCGYDRSAYLPFGGGRRQCIGKNLGLGILHQVVAAVSGRLRLRLTSGQARTGAYTTLFPKGGIRVTAEERRP